MSRLIRVLQAVGPLTGIAVLYAAVEGSNPMRQKISIVANIEVDHGDITVDVNIMKAAARSLKATL